MAALAAGMLLHIAAPADAAPSAVDRLASLTRFTNTAEPYVARRNDEDLITDGFAAELFIPAHVLAAHTVVFDYPARRLEVHPASQPSGRGAPVPCPFRRRPGWPAVHARIGDSLVPPSA